MNRSCPDSFIWTLSTSKAHTKARPDNSSFRPALGRITCNSLHHLSRGFTPPQHILFTHEQPMLNHQNSNGDHLSTPLFLSSYSEWHVFLFFLGCVTMFTNHHLHTGRFYISHTFVVFKFKSPDHSNFCPTLIHIISCDYEVYYIILYMRYLSCWYHRVNKS